MQLNFLCANHKMQFNDNSEFAIHSCVNTCEASWSLYQQRRWQEALPYIGSAFETAEILLTNQVVMEASAIDWFLHTLAGLTQTLKNLGRIEACQQVYQNAIDRLEQERRREPIQALHINLQINRLSHELKLLHYYKPSKAQRPHLREQTQLRLVMH